MKLILFDFDGVLVDTLGIVFGINAKAEPGLTLEKYKSFFHGNIHDSIKAGKKKLIPDFEEQYIAETRELKVPPELKQIVQKLSLNYTLAIVSSSSNSMIKTILEREGIDTRFADVLGSDVHTNKATKIKLILEKHKSSAADAVFITDTVGDVNEARACEVPAIAVTWGFHDEETLREAHPAKIVSTPAGLAQAIAELL